MGCKFAILWGVCATVFGVLLLPIATFAQQSRFTPQFCVTPPHDQICAEFPDDQTDFSASFEYMVVSGAAQEPFDFFSWQAFVALNWPVSAEGEALPSLTDPSDRRTWQQFHRREEVLAQDAAAEHCGGKAETATVIAQDLAQADGSVLIDQSGNFVVYETRLNPAAEGYILENALQTLAGQQTRGDTPVAFPLGRIGVKPASVLIKTAWRVLTDPKDAADFIQSSGVIYVPPDRAADGQAMCVDATLALVGMHIVTRVGSGNGDEWIWSTFEHRRNAPTATNARNINSIYANDLFPGGCKAPEGDLSEAYSFFDVDCPECKTNTAASQPWQWASTAPFALVGGAPASPSQIVRCWEVFEETQRVSRLWHDRVAGSGLENYILISTQWRGANISPLFEHGEVPRFLTNTTMETFLQDAEEGTCLGCHADAETAAGQNANFTFLLRDVN